MTAYQGFVLERVLERPAFVISAAHLLAVTLLTAAATSQNFVNCRYMEFPFVKLARVCSGGMNGHVNGALYRSLFILTIIT